MSSAPFGRPAVPLVYHLIDSQPLADGAFRRGGWLTSGPHRQRLPTVSGRAVDRDTLADSGQVGADRIEHRQIFAGSQHRDRAGVL